MTTDNQFVVVTPHEAQEITREGDELLLRGAFGRGLEFSAPDQSFAVQLRARAQIQAFASDTQQGEPAIGALIRRMRMLFGGHALGGRVSYYIQLGFSARDLEVDRPVPLRDAFLTLHANDAVNIRIGQMKVPFDRQRVMSSSKLQIVERSDVVDALNLDRDVGLQLYGDLLGRHLRYHVGFFGGDGRNRSNEGSGLLYVGRLRFFLTDPFDDDVESDMARSSRLRVALNVAAGYNDDARRERSTQGMLIDDGSIDYRHGAADLVVKFAGASLTAQALYREGIERNLVARVFFRNAETPASLRGWFVQGGYLTPWNVEVAGRVGRLEPLAAPDTGEWELTGAVSWYVIGNDLKLQAAHTVHDSALRVEHVARIQTQLFF